METATRTIARSKRTVAQYPTLLAAIDATGQTWGNGLIRIGLGDRLADSQIDVFAVPVWAGYPSPDEPPVAEVKIVGPIDPAAGGESFTLEARDVHPETYPTLESAIDDAKRRWPGCMITIDIERRGKGHAWSVTVHAPTFLGFEDYTATITRDKAGARRPRKVAKASVA